MARQPRIDIGNHVYHIINRANGRARIFSQDEDYRDFEYLLNEMRETYDIRILAYVIMPNHWHLMLYPKKDGDLGRALHWLTTSHVRRHHSRKETIGHGHLYQGTYKSFLVQTDEHFLSVLKYVERNAVRAKLCKTSESWKWCSAYRRLSTNQKEKRLLAKLPVPLPREYRTWINDPEPSELLKEVRDCVSRGVSYGEVEVRRPITQHK
jgi:putative transposase